MMGMPSEGGGCEVPKKIVDQPPIYVLVFGEELVETGIYKRYFVIAHAFSIGRLVSTLTGEDRLTGLRTDDQTTRSEQSP
jgi:hypothetical protein